MLENTKDPQEISGKSLKHLTCLLINEKQCLFSVLEYSNNHYLSKANFASLSNDIWKVQSRVNLLKQGIIVKENI